MTPVSVPFPTSHGQAHDERARKDALVGAAGDGPGRRCLADDHLVRTSVILYHSTPTSISSSPIKPRRHAHCDAKISPGMVFPLSVLAGALALLDSTRVLAVAVNLPRISPQATNASQLIDRRLASFSFEAAFLPTFAGNYSHPNLLTKELMLRLEERTGLGPDIRPGGITIDSSVFDPNAPALDLTQSAVSCLQSNDLSMY